MKIKEVLIKANEKVSFPLSRSKIKKAGYNITDYLVKLLGKLESCEDYDYTNKDHKKLSDVLIGLKVVKKKNESKRNE